MLIADGSDLSGLLAVDGACRLLIPRFPATTNVPLLPLGGPLASCLTSCVGHVPTAQCDMEIVLFVCVE